MSYLSRALCAWALVAPLAACGAIQRAPKPVQGDTAPPPATPVQKASASPDNPDSAIIADFNRRIDDYVKMKRALAEQSPDFKETKDPADIKDARETMAAKIRAARKDAKQGDILTPEVAALFKSLMYPELKGREGRATKQTLEEEDGEVAQIWLKVNTTWPPTEPLTTTPPNILANLPQLPEKLEYRVTNKRHLVLRDVDGNIIIDFIYNALR